MNKYLLISVLVSLVVAFVAQYRTNLSVLIGAVKTIATMKQSDYDAFINSYDVFDDPQHTVEDETKVNAVYKLLVPLMELGNLRKFYIPPLMDSERATFLDLNWNQELFERKMADTMKLSPGKVALDIGCGQGLVAEMAQQHSSAKVIGINISPEQIARAKANAKNKGKLGTVLDFQLGSMNEALPFPDQSFDAVYIVQASTYAHDFSSLMAEVRRVLKPGGIFADLAIPTLNKYDPSNETHIRMAAEGRRVGVIPDWRPVQYYVDGCTNNGFTILESEHLGHHQLMQAATDYFTPLGKVIGALNYIGLVSDKLVSSMDRMNEHAQSLIHGDREGLFTTNYWLVCQSPL